MIYDVYDAFRVRAGSWVGANPVVCGDGYVLNLNLIPFGGQNLYLHLGDRSRSLLEVVVSPETLVVQGFTLVLQPEVSSWPRFELRGLKCQIPVLCGEVTGSGTYGVVDVESDFHIAVRGSEFIVYWGDISVVSGWGSDDVCALVRSTGSGEVLSGFFFRSEDASTLLLRD